MRKFTLLICLFLVQFTFAAAKQTFNPNVLKSLGTGFAWGIAGAVVDGASDQYENSLYDDTLKFFIKLIEDNSKSKGINVIANNI